MPPIVRPFRPEDTDAVVQVVETVFREYGFSWDPEGYCADLWRVAETYDAFWVAELEGDVVGCVGFELHDPVPGVPGGVAVVEGDVRASATDCELVRLYVLPSARGHSLGRTLTETVRAEAMHRGREAIELWSDKKLVHAHALYERLGASRVGERICPGDPDQSPEWGFRLPVAP